MKTYKIFLILIAIVIMTLSSCKTQKYGCYEFSEYHHTVSKSGFEC